MAQNVGKKFEQDFKASVPDNMLLYRIADSTPSFGGGNLRFSIKNPFDYILWDSDKHILYALELKSVSGKSISFERKKEDAGVIHYHQIRGLNDWNKYDGIISGFVINFRDLEKTIFISIDEFNDLMVKIVKKSFTIEDLNKNNIKYTVMSSQKLRTRYRYKIEDLLIKGDG